jgi:hypothetical protein
LHGFAVAIKTNRTGEKLPFTKSSGLTMPEVKAVPWQHSEAKSVLTSDIFEGTLVKPEMTAQQVLATRAELYAPYKKNFATNLRNLRRSLKALQGRADEDQAAVVHDLERFPRSMVNPRGHPRFDGSAAQRLLKQDVDNGEDVGVKPMAFRNTRPEYEQFPLKVFRDHLSHERQRRVESSYWLNKRKKPNGS